MTELTHSLGLSGSGTKILNFDETEYAYTPLFEFEPVVAVIVSGILSLLNTFVMFSYWYWFNNSIIDLINFGASAAIYFYQFIMFIVLIFDLDGEGSRGMYYWASLISVIAPFIFWPLTFIGYLIHSFMYQATYSSTSYIVVKILLFLIYNLVVIFFDYETVFPIYMWWQILAGLADRIPYTRPTEAEVRAVDKLEYDDDFDPFVVDDEFEDDIDF